MTKHTLNIGLLLRTAAVLGVLVVLTSLVHGWQMRRHADGQLSRADQAERAGQQPHRLPLRGGSHPPLQVTDRPQADPGPIRPHLLRQPSPQTQLPEHTSEQPRRLRHRPPSSSLVYLVTFSQAAHSGRYQRAR
jgi:hypothetical protein